MKLLNTYPQRHTWSSAIVPTMFAMIFILANTCVAQSDSNQNSDSSSTIKLTVVDQTKQPIVGADVKLLRRPISDWREAGISGRTDTDGKLELKSIQDPGYLATVITHSKFAPVMITFSLAANEQREMTVTLLRPVESNIIVRSPDGKPIAGAEVSRLDLASPDSELSLYLDCDTFPLLTGRPKSDFKSDAEGRLRLPPLPANSLGKFRIVHPLWVAAATEEIDVTPGTLTTVELKTGTQVTLNLRGKPDVLTSLKGREISVSTFADFTQDSGDGRPSLLHKFKAHNNQLTFCLPPGQYDAFYVESEDVVITPSLPSSLSQTAFNHFTGSQITNDCVVRKTQAVRGRVVTSDGKPVAGATVMVNTENLIGSSDGKFVPDEVFPWAFVDVVETDKEGYFSSKAPAGKIQLDAQWSKKYYADPMEADFKQNQQTIADFVVKPLPTITGQVTNSAGEAVASAVVRVLSLGEAKYQTTDGQGNFSIQIGSFDHDKNTKKKTLESSLLVFDPSSDQATLMQVSLKEPSHHQNVDVKLESQKPNWIVDVVTDYKKRQNDDDLLANIAKYRTASQTRHPLGIPGQQCPEISTGTWFNTDAQSLDDLRGKFVLLDFWFIGCGPCERDFPNLRLAQKLFADQGFTVLSIHTPNQTPESVKQYMDARGNDYPIVVDDSSSTITNVFETAGIDGYPSYLLVDPDGKIVANDNVFGDDDSNGMLSFRVNKLELIYSHLRRAAQKSKEK